MNLPQNFADIHTAREATQSLYPNAQNITMIEHGYDNIVALVDASYAVRFPRNKNAYLRSLYEKRILQRLETTKTIIIPRILGGHNDPPYIITSFVPGHHISSASIQTLSKSHQHDFAELVAQFAFAMHKTFVINDELPLRKEFGLDELEEEEPWPIYYKRVVHDNDFPTVIQDEIAKSCYADWVKLCDVDPTVVVHDDLHSQNMMFNDDNHLIGILDFGDTNVGTPEQELRQLYRINEDVMLAGVEEYQHLSGQQLNIEALKAWATMKELADYSKALAVKNTSHNSFKRASHNLNLWFPKGEWGKGYDLSEIEGYQ